jgi:hypothetical protein
MAGVGTFRALRFRWAFPTGASIVRPLDWVTMLLSGAVIVSALMLGYRDSGSIRSGLFQRGKRPIYLVCVLLSLSSLSSTGPRLLFQSGSTPHWIGIASSFAFTLTAIWFMARRPKPLA